MIIQHNMSALRTIQYINKPIKSAEKLSSGYKINRASDDAAGLTISEKMRSQIRGLSMAQKNAQDGISLIQTADGAMGEIQNILQRMRELTVQAANDVNTTTDREAIQIEIGQLNSEIDRIAEETEFNTNKILSGAFKEGTEMILKKASYQGEIDFSKACNGLTITINGETFEFDTDGQMNDAGAIRVDISSASTANEKAQALINAFNGSILADDFTIGMDAVNNNMLKIEGKTERDRQEIKVSCGQTIPAIPSGELTVDTIPGIATILNFPSIDLSKIVDGSTLMIDDYIFEFNTDGKLNNSGSKVVEVNFTTSMTNAQKARALVDAFGNSALASNRMLSGTMMSIDNPNIYEIEIVDFTSSPIQSLKLNEAGTLPTEINRTNEVMEPGVNRAKPMGINIQIGANSYQSMVLSIDGVTTEALGIQGIEVTDGEEAEKSISKIETAIESISSNRSVLGAYQNRLEHALENLKVGEENLTASESRIRDADMAKEITLYAKDNILQQSAEAMLVQANKNQGLILNLLQ